MRDRGGAICEAAALGEAIGRHVEYRHEERCAEAQTGDGRARFYQIAERAAMRSATSSGAPAAQARTSADRGDARNHAALVLADRDREVAEAERSAAQRRVSGSGRRGDLLGCGGRDGPQVNTRGTGGPRKCRISRRTRHGPVGRTRSRAAARAASRRALPCRPRSRGPRSARPRASAALPRLGGRCSRRVSGPQSRRR